MKVLNIISDFFRGEVESFVTTTKRLKRLSSEALAAGGKKALSGSQRAGRIIYSHLTDTQKARQITQVTIIVIFILAFLLWQFLAYDLPQTLFVAINILFFASLLTFICISRLRTYRTMMDLNQTIDEIAQGRRKKEHEVVQLKADIQELKMQIDNKMAFGKNSQLLMEAIRKNRQQQRPTDMRCQYLLRSLAQCYQICGGVVYMRSPQSGKLELAAQYAIGSEGVEPILDEDKGIVGQAIADGKAMTFTDVDVDYLSVVSGLGQATKVNLYVLPVTSNEGKTVAIIEVTSFGRLAIANIWKDIEKLILAEI